MKNALIIFISFGLTACSSFQRSENSGYGYRDNYAPKHSTQKNYFKAKAQQRVDRAKSELGIREYGQISENQVRQIRTRMMLEQLENELVVPAERNQYYSLKPYFKNDLERIRFLSLPSAAHKKKYIQIRGISEDIQQFDKATVTAIETNDIIVGMTKKAVKESWGDPDFVEIAGEPLYGNERWGYLKYVSSENGYNKEQRIIVFESGLVAGWERQ